MAKSDVILGAYYQGQDSADDPDEYISLAVVKELERSGQGRFINRGRAFRLFTRCTPHDPSQYGSSQGRGKSLNIGPEMVHRYVAREPYAVAAVEAWRSLFFRIGRNDSAAERHSRGCPVGRCLVPCPFDRLQPPCSVRATTALRESARFCLPRSAAWS